MPPHMPVHANYPPQGYPQPGHPMHHHPSRQHSTGPPGPIPGGPPPPLNVNGPPTGRMPMGGPHPDAVVPPSAPLSNGHARGTPVPSVLSPAARAGKEKQEGIFQQLAHANENTWMLIGAVAEQMDDPKRALEAFETALSHNPNSALGLSAIGKVYRDQDQFDKAIEYFQRSLNIKQDNGEVWGSMGHCLLMQDDLPKAYTAYQQALHYLPNPKEPKLWHGIGILYDRYGSFEHAEEAFSSVLKMAPNFEKANEIYFRLGIIYKHQRKYGPSLQCFQHIINNPPRPLTSWDIHFQLGHVFELNQDYVAARDAYMRVLDHQPDHAKVLQQLGWLYCQPGAPFANQEQGVQYLTDSLATDGSDAQSWYLLGRAFMAGQSYNKAYQAYQQAVYRDGRNPTFWCSIGVLYFQINQYRDALDAYSRAIRINPYIWEVWFNLGSLYESCNNQITDAVDAYQRAAELEPHNHTIKHRLQLLQNGGNQQLPPPPSPVDVHPAHYNSNPQGYNAGSPGGSPRLMEAQHPPEPPVDGIAQPGRGDLPPPPIEFGRQHSPGPFRGGGAPPPLANVDESRGNMARHAPLAPIDTERHRSGPSGPQGGRYDPALDARHQPSPNSPRARRPDGPPGYFPPGYDEWDRRRDGPGPGPGGPALGPGGPGPPGVPPGPGGPGGPRMHHDPRGPSPLPNEARGPISRTTSRDFQGRPDFQRPYPYDERDPRDLRDPRDPRDPRFYEPHPDERGGPPGWNRNGRRPSIAREQLGDMRAPSPAASTSSKASRRAVKKEDPRRVSMPKRTDPSPRQSPAPSRRTIDEDYDEGAADALMFLHSDRRQPPPEQSPPVVAGTKRPSPPSPELSRPVDSKKSRGSPFANSPTKRQTVIEVLNAPRATPTPRIEVLNKPHDKPLSPRPRSPEIHVRAASKPPTPSDKDKQNPTTPLGLTSAPTSDARTSPVASRSSAARSPEVMPRLSKSPDHEKKSPPTTGSAPAQSPKISSARDKEGDVEMEESQ